MIALLFLFSILISTVWSADKITECRLTPGGSGFSYREIDKKKCWYQGAPGRSKSLLRWTKFSPPQRSSGVGKDRPEIGVNPLQPNSDLGADSRAPIAPIMITTEEIAPWQANPQDQTQAFTCCWPELEPNSPLPTIVRQLPRATPPVQPLWPIIFLPVTIIAVAFLFIERRI